MKTKSSPKNGYISDDDNVRYKINTNYYIKARMQPKADTIPVNQKQNELEDHNTRYMFPNHAAKKDEKSKSKSKFKVNFWSSKNKPTRVNKSELKQKDSSRRHTIATSSKDFKRKATAVKVRKRVSFLPSPLFSDNHDPMVTVPDDLTINLNEEEANYLREDLNSAFLNNGSESVGAPNTQNKRKSKSSIISAAPKGIKRKSVSDVHDNDNELEYFSKYVVQKLRKMETNQRIYSENLINIVLMLGQFGKLNGKSKILDT